MERLFMRSPALVLIGLLCGCVPPPPPDVDVIISPPVAAADLSSCGATDQVVLVGGPVAALPRAGGWGTVRVIHPGDAVTEDFSPTRLNVEVDGQDLILRLSCG